jgi:hypothetical protein
MYKDGCETYAFPFPANTSFSSEHMLFILELIHPHSNQS